MHKAIATVLFASALASGAAADDTGTQSPALGRALSAQELRSLRSSVLPDGRGLPPGEGTAALGKALFAERCATCHGEAATGGDGPELAYAQMALDSEFPDKTIGSYWPHATSVFDFIRRAMPLNAPNSLTADEAYALTAYLLHLNGLLDADARLDADSLSAIEMPNRDGFRWIDAAPPP